jgi:hypothetical protein
MIPEISMTSTSTKSGIQNARFFKPVERITKRAPEFNSWLLQYCFLPILNNDKKKVIHPRY